jgi:hypothetical protein
VHRLAAALRLLLDTGKAWEHADFRLRITNLINALTDARTAIWELGEEVCDRDRRIAGL